MSSQNQPFSTFVGDDFKRVLEVVGFDLSATPGFFRIGVNPDAAPMLEPSVTCLLAQPDSDGVMVSLVQVFAPQATVEAAVASVGGLPGGQDLTLPYVFGFDALPGDLGTDAVTTILFGDFTFRGSIDG